MVCANRNAALHTRVIDSSIVLFARILDGAGRPVRATDVVAVQCSVREPGSHEPGIEFDASPFDVILPALVRGNSWTIDDVGYNFRHDLTDITRFVDVAAPEFNRHLVVSYMFTLTDCTRSVLRFHLKLM